MMHSLLKKSTLYLAGLTVSKIINVLVFIFIARRFSPDLFGEFTFFITLIQFVTYFADFGLIQWYMKKVVSATERNSYYIKVITLRTITLLLSIIILVTFLVLTKTFDLTMNFMFILTLIAESFMSVTDGYYFEKQDSFRVTLKTIIRMGLFFLGLLLLTATNTNDLIFMYLLATFITFVWYLPWSLVIKIKPVNITESVTMLTSASPYALLIITSFAYSRGDALLIKYILNNAALGMYSAAYRFLETLSLIPTALSHNLFPIAAKEKGISLTTLSQIMMIFIGMGVLFGVFLYFSSELLITLLIGEKYLEAVPILKVFSFGVFFFFINAPLSTVIQSSHIVKRFLPLGIANTVLNIVLNIITLPMYGVIAAAVVMVITEATGFIINLYFIKKIYEQRND